MASDTLVVATVLITGPPDGRLLVVWNRKLRGWTLPGGKVKEDETLAQAASRELQEETSIIVDPIDLVRIYTAAPPASEGPEAPKTVHVHWPGHWQNYRPHEMEPGCPVSWFTREDFLASSPVREFYEGCFTAINGAVR
jgi:8-oxo-dGTP pyrophosphatase MutT (NUDIX family)